MATEWFITAYGIRTGGWRPVRYCLMDDYTPVIYGEGGAWSETEVLGGYALVKVTASESTLATIEADNRFFAFPNRWGVTDTLQNLTNAQYNVIRNRLRQMGYTDAEIDATLGANVAQWRQHTLLELLNFAAQRRLKPRWDEVLQQIVLDGPAVSCKPPIEVDGEVS